MLATKRVVDVACGSLHCLVCTEDGKVYAWGDNDEGQIGNDSTSACQVAHVSLFIVFRHHLQLEDIGNSLRMHSSSCRKT